MSFDEAEVQSDELGIDLDNPEFSGIKIDRYSFIKIMEPNQHGVIDLSDFGSGFMIPEAKNDSIATDGIYLKMESDRLLASLTPNELESLLDHPFGRPDMPVLAFPFTLKKLKTFLDWAESAGHDFPINEQALGDVIRKQRTSQPELEKNEIEVNQSDATLGAQIRERNRQFAEKPREERDARNAEKQRWRDIGAEIQQSRVKKASSRQLAELVKKQLNLPDSTEIIRKALAKSK